MNNYKNYCLFAILLFGAVFSGCNKYLDEYNPAGRTDNTFYNTASGFENLVKANYSNLRGIINSPNMYFVGTDIFSSYGRNDNNGLNLYNSNLTPMDGNFSGYWRQLYYAINIANTTLYWATQVKDEESSLLNQRVGEAKTLRSFYYFLLVETFGDVPLQLQPTTSPIFAFTRTPEKDVYQQIITDLTDAIQLLPASVTEQGRVTKGVAQHLLSKVYLTRAYKLYGDKNNDFKMAAKLADDVISGPYSLDTVYANLFDPTITDFQNNKEVIFSVQYSSDPQTNSGGNSLQQYFLWDTQIVPFIGRSGLYGKPNYSACPTPFLFSLFDREKDSRYAATFWNVIYAQNAADGFAVGDTAVYYPDSIWSQSAIDGEKYYVINPDKYGSSPFPGLTRCYPEPKKFRELNLPYQDGGGFRSTYVFRLAETYLIGAEANLGLNNMDKALEMFNKVRMRAAKPGTDPRTNILYSTEMKVSKLTLDDILDERARELFGEEFRWFELKRTGRLISRTLAHNEEAKAAGSLDEHFLLRPIPQEDIDLNQTVLKQNPGYN